MLDNYPIGTLVREDIELAGMDVKRLHKIRAIEFVSAEQAAEYGKADADPVEEFGEEGGEQDQEPEA